MVNFSQLDNGYMDTLFSNIHTKSEDWELLNPSDAVKYLPVSKRSLQFSNLLMKSKVIPHPQRHANQMKRLNLFEAEIINGKS